jgi:hypothetical protein
MGAAGAIRRVSRDGESTGLFFRQPRQKAASFNLDTVLRQLSTAMAAGTAKEAKKAAEAQRKIDWRKSKGQLNAAAFGAMGLSSNRLGPPFLFLPPTSHWLI